MSVAQVYSSEPLSTSRKSELTLNRLRAGELNDVTPGRLQLLRPWHLVDRELDVHTVYLYCTSYFTLQLAAQRAAHHLDLPPQPAGLGAPPPWALGALAIGLIALAWAALEACYR